MPTSLQLGRLPSWLEGLQGGKFELDTCRRVTGAVGADHSVFGAGQTAVSAKVCDVKRRRKTKKPGSDSPVGLALFPRRTPKQILLGRKHLTYI